MIVDSFPDRTIQIEGKEHLYFGGTAYLGIPTNRSFQKTLSKCLNKWGSFYGSSRNSNIKLSIFKEVEEVLAKQIGAEDSVTTSSGTLAGVLVLDYLSKSENTFYHFPKTHPAILQRNSVPLFIEGKLHPNLLNTTKEDIVITADAISGFEVEPTSFQFLSSISSYKRITLLVDESHSLGIVGKQGEGVFNTISNNNMVRKIMIASLGKALGISGGIIASDKIFIDAIKNEILFISSSCANPAYLEAFKQSQDLLIAQRKKLRANLAYLEQELKSNKELIFNVNYPVIYLKNDNVFESLLKEKIVIARFKYPTYTGYMNRIVITANHSFEDIKKLVEVLNRA